MQADVEFGIQNNQTPALGGAQWRTCLVYEVLGSVPTTTETNKKRQAPSTHTEKPNFTC